MPDIVGDLWSLRVGSGQMVAAHRTVAPISRTDPIVRRRHQGISRRLDALLTADGAMLPENADFRARGALFVEITATGCMSVACRHDRHRLPLHVWSRSRGRDNDSELTVDPRDGAITRRVVAPNMSEDLATVGGDYADYVSGATLCGAVGSAGDGVQGVDQAVAEEAPSRAGALAVGEPGAGAVGVVDAVWWAGDAVGLVGQRGGHSGW